MTSKKNVIFEKDIESNLNKMFMDNGNRLPGELPKWLMALGVKSNSEIDYIKRVGNDGGKTDILIALKDSVPIKVSVKLSSADYFGNWYSHKRVIKEFGEEAFEKLTNACTVWANKWLLDKNASLFVGVSVSFGKRSGETLDDFLSIFSPEDIIKIVSGIETEKSSANCLYISSTPPNNICDFLINLKPIETKVVEEIGKNFHVIYRPVNPITEISNRGKCVYSKFKLHKDITEDEEIIVENLISLKNLGKFVPVRSDSENHAKIIKDLKKNGLHLPTKKTLEIEIIIDGKESLKLKKCEYMVITEERSEIIKTIIQNLNGLEDISTEYKYLARQANIPDIYELSSLLVSKHFRDSFLDFETIREYQTYILENRIEKSKIVIIFKGFKGKNKSIKYKDLLNSENSVLETILYNELLIAKDNEIFNKKYLKGLALAISQLLDTHSLVYINERGENNNRPINNVW